MKHLLALLILGWSASAAGAEPPKRPPVVAPVVADAEPPKRPPVAAARPVMQAGYWSLRPPQGHTHTCPNPECRLTWDHTTNPGHNCRRCGTLQLDPDPFPKMVHWWNPATPPDPVMPAYTPPVPVAASPPVVAYTLPGSFGGGGCANGSCSAGGGRGGFFRR